MPLEENADDSNKKFTIWGVLLCFRFMIQHLAELDKCSMSLSNLRLSSKNANILFSPSSSFNESISATANATTSTNTTSSVRSPKKSINYFGLLNLCQVIILEIN